MDGQPKKKKIVKNGESGRWEKKNIDHGYGYYESKQRNMKIKKRMQKKKKETSCQKKKKIRFGIDTM